MKWSDGEPYSVDDVMFWYEDVLLDEGMYIHSVVPSWFTSGGEPGVLEKIDDHTFSVTFETPNGLFLHDLATPPAREGLSGWPRHYLEQFHIKYNPDADQSADDEGLADWAELLNEKNDPLTNPDRPVLFPWRILTPRGEDRVRAERNPYYWKVDPDGRQLPYVDEVVYDLFSDEDVVVLRLSNGELDMQFRSGTSLANKPVLSRSRESGDYHFFDVLPAQMNRMMIALNLTHRNETLREIFRNKDFRIGLSHAINRAELIDTVWQRQGEPWQGRRAGSRGSSTRSWRNGTPSTTSTSPTSISTGPAMPSGTATDSGWARMVRPLGSR